MSELMMDDADGVLGMLKESVVAFSKGFPGAKGLRQLRESQNALDKKQWKEMADAGWIGLLLSEAQGGAGLSIKEQAVISHALGQELVTSPIASSAVFASAILNSLDASEERSRLAAVLLNADQLVVPVTGGKITAVLNGQDFILNGKSEYLDAVQEASDFIIQAHDAEGVQYLFSVPAQSSGISRKDHRAVDGTTLSILSLNDTAVPAAQLLTKGHLSAQLGQCSDLAMLAVASELAGIASKLVALTSEYMQQREQFGQPIAKFQVIQHRLVDMWADAEFACAAIDNAVERLVSGHGIDSHLAVLAAKVRASESATSIGRRAVHLYGAMGFTAECDIGLYLKRAINLAASFGDAEKLRIKFVQTERAN
ncbi:MULTISPECIES: acyl-CoA dehydrogenase family protein [unclassified Acinetobacter]|uniref:acyl-CoA dehydrogenase family protein n=1 Tax=unclassified Acinetobacter TaxID=196816 RepID=UPI0015D10C28|nr:MULTISPECIES: acyl-CoA dehydrogenase family protein [unclassified Acinetobacter]